MKPLEAFYHFSETCRHLKVISGGENKSMETIEKHLKALEIIANKCRIELEHKVVNNGVDIYWMILNGALTIELYKEEYDLLKEVLE